MEKRSRSSITTQHTIQPSAQPLPVGCWVPFKLYYLHFTVSHYITMAPLTSTWPEIISYSSRAPWYPLQFTSRRHFPLENNLGPVRTQENGSTGMAATHHTQQGERGTWSLIPSSGQQSCTLTPPTMPENIQICKSQWMLPKLIGICNVKMPCLKIIGSLKSCVLRRYVKKAILGVSESECLSLVTNSHAVRNYS